MKVQFGYKQTYINELSKKLNQALANTMVLYVKTLNGHWNLEYHNFIAIHEMLEEQYTQLASNLDLIAERIRNIGERPASSLKEMLKVATMKEMKSTFTFKSLMEDLSSSHEMSMQDLRDIIAFCDENEDPGTSDLLTNILRDHEKTAWLLRSHL